MTQGAAATRAHEQLPHPKTRMRQHPATPPPVGHLLSHQLPVAVQLLAQQRVAVGPAAQRLLHAAKGAECKGAAGRRGAGVQRERLAARAHGKRARNARHLLEALHLALQLCYALQVAPVQVALCSRAGRDRLCSRARLCRCLGRRLLKLPRQAVPLRLRHNHLLRGLGGIVLGGLLRRWGKRVARHR